jgi:hypothetical protein
MDNEKISKGIGNLTEILTKTAGLLILLSLVAAYVGFRHQSVYFNTAGAPWIVHLLSPSELILKSWFLILALAFGMLAAIMDLFISYRVRQFRSIFNIMWGLIFACILLYVLVAWADIKYLQIVLVFAGLIILSMGGFLVGDAIRFHVYRNHKWGEEHILLVVAIICCLHIGSSAVGGIQAKLVMKSSSLPAALVGNEKDGWYLLCTVGDKYVLVSLREGGFSQFRLVPISSEVIISGKPLPPIQSTPTSPNTGS